MLTKNSTRRSAEKDNHDAKSSGSDTSYLILHISAFLIISMNICFISNLFPIPDQPQRGVFSLQLVRALSKKADVKVVVPVPGMRSSKCEFRNANLGTNEEEKPYKTTYLPVFHIPFFGRNLTAWFHHKALNKIRSQIQSADIILSSWLYPDGVAASRFGQDLGVPVWIKVLGSDIFHLKNRHRRKMILDACKQAAGIICVAQHLKDALVVAGVDESKVHVVSDGVDTKLFHPPSSGDNNEDTNNSIINHPKSASRIPHSDVLWVGNLVPVKGPDLMLDVWENLQRECLNSITETTQQPNNPTTHLHLTLIGDGPLRSSLERRVQKSGLADSVAFRGSISHEKVAEEMRRAALLCVSSRSEGLPSVILESLASGLPVVASNVGAVDDMIGGHDSCKVIDDGPDFARSFTQALKCIVRKNIDRETLARNAKVGTWDDVAATMLELMQ